MIQKLVSLYEKHSLHPTLAGTDICLRFAETHKVNVVVRYVESCHPLEMAQVEKHYKKLRQLGKRVGCTQFRLVAPNGFTSECYDQYRYTVALGDSRYVSSLENDVHIELFAHNENTYAKMIDEFKREGRVAVVQATGTGKSLLIARWIAEHPKQKILVLAPSYYIVDEIKKHLPQTLCEQVCWMTYMRLARMTPQEREAIEADFVALDEFHRCGAIEWGAGVYQLLEHLPQAKVLGTSATPIRYLDAGRDMAEELFGGSIVQNLSLAKALALNILPTPKYVTAIYDIEPICKQINKQLALRRPANKSIFTKEIKELRERWNNGIGVPLILKKHLLPNTRKVLVFCKNIKQLQQVRSVVHQWFLTIYTCKVNMYELHTEFNQRSVFDEFERPKNNEIDVLLSINMLCEGIHTKGIDAVVMLRDTVSPNVYFQQLGRCLTVQRDTTPVVFDMVNNLDNIRMDDFVREYNATCRALLGDHKSAEPNEQRFRVIDELQDWRVLYQKTMDISEKWDAMYAKLKEHYNQHGTLRLYLHPRHELTRWCSYVRMRHRQGRLSEDQVRKLNEIEFIWEDRCQDAWNRRYDELCAFYHEHGHSNVSAILNKSLLGWCRDQKRRKLEGGLSLEQIEKLDAVNFNWVIQKSDWHKWYAQLKEFFEQNGHCRIVGNGRSLRGWCVRTRALYHQNKLSQEQIRLMEQLNFSWDVWGDAWQTNIQKLRAFKEQYGNCLVPPSVDIVLARWVFGLRNDRKRGCLSEEQIQQLDEVGFVWDPEQHLWLETYQAMKWHLKVTKRNKPLTKETRLFGWYKNQKQLIRANRMPADRIKLLMDIGLDVFEK